MGVVRLFPKLESDDKIELLTVSMAEEESSSKYLTEAGVTFASLEDSNRDSTIEKSFDGGNDEFITVSVREAELARSLSEISRRQKIYFVSLSFFS